MNDTFKTYSVDITCDSSGDATAYIYGVECLLYALEVIKGDTSIANTSDITFSVVGNFPKTFLTLTNLDVTSTPALYHPRADSHGATGSALSANNILPALSGNVKIVIAQGGNGGQARVNLLGL